MANEKPEFTQAQVDHLIQRHAAEMKELRAKFDTNKEEAISEGMAEGIMRGADWLNERADQLEAADVDRGFFEAEIAILRWAAKRVGSL